MDKNSLYLANLNQSKHLYWINPTQLCFIQYLQISFVVEHLQAINTTLNKEGTKCNVHYIIGCLNVVFTILWFSTSTGICSYWIKHNCVGLNHESVYFEHLNTTGWVQSNLPEPVRFRSCPHKQFLQSLFEWYIVIWA